MSNYQMEDAKKTIRILSDGNNPDHNPRLVYHRWSEDNQRIAKKLFNKHQDGGLLALGAVHHDALWAVAHPNGEHRPEPPPRPPIPAPNATNGTWATYREQKERAEAHRDADATLLQCLLDSISDEDKTALGNLHGGLNDVTTVQIVNYAYNEYGKLRITDFDHLKTTVFKHKITVVSELNNHVAKLALTFKQFADAHNPVSNIEQTDYFLESLSLVPHIQTFANAYINKTPIETRSLAAMFTEVKDNVTNSRVPTTGDMNYAALAERLANLLESNQKAAVVPAQAASALNDPVFFAAQVKQVLLSTQQEDRKNNGDSNKRRGGGGGRPDKKKTSKTGGDNKSTGGHGAMCPIHPGGSHLAKDCKLIIAAKLAKEY